MSAPPVARRPLLLGALAGAGAALAATAGCMSWPEPTVPMRVRTIAPRCLPRGAARGRCVLLPGVRSRADDFVHEGFVEDLQSRAPACELLLADAHLGYFVEGQLVERLRADVLRPAPMTGSGAARAAAQAAQPKPWLVGISLGGLAALAYAMRHGDELGGVLAIAPYLGRRTLLRDIAAAGGPQAWSRQPRPAQAPPPEPHKAIEEDLWRWFGSPDFGREPGDPPLYLAFGDDDRFGDALRTLAKLLPREHIDTTDGGHQWRPWRLLWQRWLERGLLGEGAGAQTAGCAGTA